MKTISYYFSLCIIFNAKTSESAKILALFTLPSGSHMNIIKALIPSLLERGHEIDLVSHFPLKINHERYSDIDISGTVPLFKDNVTIQRSYVGDIKAMVDGMDLFGIPLIDPILSTHALNNLKNSSKKYDLVIRHIFLNDAMEAFAHTFNVPSIGLITSVNLPWTSDIVGLPDNPAYIPNYYSIYGENMNYFQRVFNSILYIYLKLKYLSIQEQSNKMIKKHFGYEIPPIDELLKKSSLILCNSHYSIHQSRPLPPNFIEIGGIHIPERQKSTMPKHLKAALDSASQGFIYVSFGSLIKSETLGLQALEAMFHTLGELPHQIFWKGNRNNLPKSIQIPKKIHIEPWMPQLEILCHPNAKLFISHGGLFGIQEAVYCGVPILGIPFAVDQGSNLQLITEKNVAKLLTYESVSKETFSEAVKTLLEKTYKRNAENLSKLFTDRPMSPMATAIYWIEYVIKYNGALHIKTSSTKLRWYQYLLLDVIGFFLILLLMFNIVVYFIILNLRKMIRNINICWYIYSVLKNKIKAE